MEKKPSNYHQQFNQCKHSCYQHSARHNWVSMSELHTSVLNVDFFCMVNPSVCTVCHQKFDVATFFWCLICPLHQEFWPHEFTAYL